MWEHYLCDDAELVAAILRTQHGQELLVHERFRPPQSTAWAIDFPTMAMACHRAREYFFLTVKHCDGGSRNIQRKPIVSRHLAVMSEKQAHV